MSGSLQQHPAGFDKRKHDHVILTFNGAKLTQLHYHDPRRFGMLLWLDEYEDKLITHLGVEPLSEDFSADYLYHHIHNRKNWLNAPSNRWLWRKRLWSVWAHLCNRKPIFIKNSSVDPCPSYQPRTALTLVAHIRQVPQTSIEKVVQR